MILTRDEVGLLRSAKEQELEDFLSTLPPSEFDAVLLQLTEETEDDEQPVNTVAGGYASAESARVAAHNNKKTAESQEIGPLPFVVDPIRRESCRFDLRLYAMTYFHAACWRGLSPYQVEMATTFQDVLLRGGKKARAVRRGGLKSTLARIATAWAIDYGHRKFPVLIGATDDKANEHRDNFLDMLKSSAEHRGDFPEWTPVLLKKANPKKMLRLNAEQLNVTAKDERGVIVFPKLDSVYDRAGNAIKVDASEARIAPYSVKATDVSGLSFVNNAGQVVRPDALILDDVQTPLSAKSDGLTSNLEDIINTTFMGLAGLGETIAAIMVCTVRKEDDLTMRFCDRKRHPDWDGQLFPTLLKMPDSKEAKAAWTTYGEKLSEGDTPERGFELASAYYSEHRDVMDAGGVVAWEQDKEDGYLSALQWCMTISIVSPDYFRCELQQQGAAPPGAVKQLDARELVKRLSHVPRGTVPAKASYLTAFVDSGNYVLWWMLCGHKPDMSSWIVDWGTWPPQPREFFDKLNPPKSLQAELPGSSWEEAFANAHNKLDEYLLGREWPIEGGGARPVDMLLKDWSDGDHKRRIEPQVMVSKYKSRIRPAKGLIVKPGGKPIYLYGDAQRDRHNFGCWLERRTDNPVHVQVDTNQAKGLTSRRLQTVVGAPSAMLLPGSDEHALTVLCDHLTSEKAKEWTVNGVDGIYYEEIPSKYNDLWDCVCGNVVASSMLGCALPGEVSLVKERKRFTMPGAAK